MKVVATNLSTKETEFFQKLSALCEEYNASIYGCGCCGSPSVDIGSSNFENLRITSEEREFDGADYGRPKYTIKKDGTVLVDNETFPPNRS